MEMLLNVCQYLMFLVIENIMFAVTSVTKSCSKFVHQSFDFRGTETLGNQLVNLH